MTITKEKRDRLILVGIITIAVAAGIWQVLIQAGGRKLEQKRVAAGKAKEKFEQAESFLKQASSIQERAEELSRELARIEETMAHPTDPFSWSIQLMEKARADHEVQIAEVAPPRPLAPIQVIPDFPYQSVSFTVRGSAYYQDLGKFLADFENEHPYCLSRSLQVTAGRLAGDAGAAGSGGPGPDRVAFRLDVVALVRPSL